MLRHMLLKTAEEYFGGCKQIARLLSSTDTRTVSAVYQWKEKGVIPLVAARQLAQLSRGKLKVDDSLYDQYGRIKNSKSN
jgi:hypothetical protein